MKALLLGLDIGSSGTKAVLHARSGREVGSGRSEYSVVTPRPGWVELVPGAVWEAVCSACTDAFRQAGRQAEHALIHAALSVVGEGLIVTDPRHVPLANGMLSCDLRSVAESRFVEKTAGRANIVRATGRIAHPMALLPRILWARRHLAGAALDNARFHDFQSWILARLGLAPMTDYSVAAGTLCFNIQSNEWDAGLLALAGLRPGNLPMPVQSGTLIGTVGSARAAAIGVPSSSRIDFYAGAMDQQCNAIGTSTVRTGQAVCSIGTVECLSLILPPSFPAARLARLGMPKIPTAVSGQYLAQAIVWNGGGALRWYCSHFVGREAATGAATGDPGYESLLRRAPADRGVLFLPYLSGAGTPRMDPQARGAFVGLSLASDACSLAHAVIEGVCFELKANIDALASIGIHVRDLCATGGGARSETWLQMKADVTGVAVRKVAARETGCLGAAIIASHGAGIDTDICDASARLCTVQKVYKPGDNARRYEKKYRVYARMYQDLRAINRQLGRDAFTEARQRARHSDPSQARLPTRADRRNPPACAGASTYA